MAKAVSCEWLNFSEIVTAPNTLSLQKKGTLGGMPGHRGGAVVGIKCDVRVSESRHAYVCPLVFLNCARDNDGANEGCDGWMSRGIGRNTRSVCLKV